MVKRASTFVKSRAARSRAKEQVHAPRGQFRKLEVGPPQAGARRAKESSCEDKRSFLEN